MTPKEKALTEYYNNEFHDRRKPIGRILDIAIQEQNKRLLSDIPCPQHSTNISILNCDCKWCMSFKEKNIK